MTLPPVTLKLRLVSAHSQVPQKLVSAYFAGLVSQHIVSQLEVECLQSYDEGVDVAPSEGT